MENKKKNLPLFRRIFGKKALKLPPLCAWDIETVGLGGKFIIASFVNTSGERLLMHSLDECFQYMLNNPQYRYLAHNAVGYEFAYLMPYIIDYFRNQLDNQIDVIPTVQGENRIVQIRVMMSKKPYLDLRDTLCLFGMSLEKVAKAFCPELPKLKGNVNFDKEIFDPTNRDHIDYVYRDSDIVLIAYQRLATNMAEVFGSPLGVTAGSTAFKAFTTTIPEGHVYYRLNSIVESFCREGYYGGLVLPGHEIGNWGKTGSVDVNGAYAYQMLIHTFPVGPLARCHTYLGENHSAFYRVIASVPSSTFDKYGFNPLPCRTKNGLCWPSGTFETVITHVEFGFALKCGVSLDVLDGYVAMREEPVFKPFIEKCQAMEIAEGGKYKPTIKLCRNSCYGKFGSKTKHNTILFSKELQLHPLKPLECDIDGSFIEGLWCGVEDTDAPYIMPHWAALITAYERVYLMEFILEAYQRGAKNVYCDTDSLKTSQQVLFSMIKDGIIPIGDNYGQFKLEDLVNQFIVLGPKTFYGKNEETGEEVLKAKGLPKNNLEMGLNDEDKVILRKDLYEQAVKGVFPEQYFISVESVMNIIKENSSVRPVKRKRRITDLRNSFSWQLVGKEIYPYGYLDNRPCIVPISDSIPIQLTG